MRNVAETTSNKNLNKVCVTFLKSVSPKKANNKTIAILIKLFATNMVASNFLGRSNSLAIICMGTDLFSIPSLILDLVKENKATSAPDIKAEHTSNIISSTTLVINDVLVTNKCEIKTVGSGSKRQLN